MTDFFTSLLKALPQVAASPLALTGYLAVIGAWVFVAVKVRRHKMLLDTLKDLPKDQRLEAITRELGAPYLNAGMEPEQWIRARIHTYLFLGFFTICLVVLIIVLAAFKLRSTQTAIERQQAAETFLASFTADAGAWSAAANKEVEHFQEDPRVSDLYQMATDKWRQQISQRDHLIRKLFGEPLRQEFQIMIVGEVDVIDRVLRGTTKRTHGDLNALMLSFDFKLHRYLVSLAESNASELEETKTAALQKSGPHPAMVIDTIDEATPGPFSAPDPVAKQLFSMRGKVVILDFYATWCGPCLSEIPALRERYKELQSQNVEFLGVCVKDRNDGYAAFINRFKLPWPTMGVKSVDDSEVCRRWHVNAVPTKYLIGADGVPRRGFIYAAQITAADIEAAKQTAPTAMAVSSSK